MRLRLFILASAAALVHSAKNKCYQMGATEADKCTKPNDEHMPCVDVLKADHLKECELDGAVCRYRRYYVGAGTDKGYRSIFDCVSLGFGDGARIGPVNSCSYRQNDKDSTFRSVECVCNDKEGCNGARGSGASSFAILTAAALFAWSS